LPPLAAMDLAMLQTFGSNHMVNCLSSWSSWIGFANEPKHVDSASFFCYCVNGTTMRLSSVNRWVFAYGPFFSELARSSGNLIRILLHAPFLACPCSVVAAHGVC
jgi:hypothetical protein